MTSISSISVASVTTPSIVKPKSSIELEAHLISHTLLPTTLVKTIHVSKHIDFSKFPSQSWHDPYPINDEQEREFIHPFTFDGKVDTSTINLFVENEGYLVYSWDGHRRYSVYSWDAYAIGSLNVQLKEKSKVYVISSSTLQSIHTLPIDEDLRFQLAFNPLFFRGHLSKYMYWGQANVFKAMIRMKNIFAEFSKLPSDEAFQERTEFLEGFVSSRISFLLPNDDRLVLRQNKAKVKSIISKHLKEASRSEKPLKGLLRLPDIILRHLSSYLTLEENVCFQKTCKPILRIAGKIQSHLKVLQKTNFWEFMLEAIKLRKPGAEEDLICFFGRDYKNIIPILQSIQNTKNNTQNSEASQNFQILCYQVQDLYENIDHYSYHDGLISERQYKLCAPSYYTDGAGKICLPPSKKDKKASKKPMIPAPWVDVIKKHFPLFCDPTTTTFEATNTYTQTSIHYFNISVEGYDYDPEKRRKSIHSFLVYPWTTIRKLSQLVKQTFKVTISPGHYIAIFRQYGKRKEEIQISGLTLRDCGITNRNLSRRWSGEPLCYEISRR